VATEQSKGSKDNNGKLQTMELWGEFQIMMAEAMTVSKKGKYPPLNWTKVINPYELLQSIERHFLEVKIAMQNCQIDTLTDPTDHIDHLVKIANNCSMLQYQLTYHYPSSVSLKNALQEFIDESSQLGDSNSKS
jgi:hypothetical protein